MATPATAPPDTPDFEGLGTPVPRGGSGGTDVVVGNVVPFVDAAVELAIVGQLNVTMTPFELFRQAVAPTGPEGQITTID